MATLEQRLRDLTAAIRGRNLRAFLAATQQTTSTTPVVLTGHTFGIPPGRTLNLRGLLIFTAAITTTGAGYGIRVVQPAGADGSVIGSAEFAVQVSAAAAATRLEDADAINAAAGASVFLEILGTASTAGNHGASCSALLWNRATNASTTVTLEFRSEVALSAVTAQIGTAALGLIG